jgi:hypothetical protein
VSAAAAFVDRLNWEHDHRNCERDEAPILYVGLPDGSVEERPLPTTWAVCDVCNGEGKHVNPSIDCGGLSAEDFADDPEFAEDYMRGAYDVTCNKCAGRTTIRAVDWDRLSAEDRALYEKQLDEEAADRAIERAERLMGA